MNVDLKPAGKARHATRKTILSLIVGALIGGVSAGAMMALIGMDQPREPDLSVVVALAVAMVYGLTGLIVVAGLAAPRAAARFLNVEDADELIEQKPSLLASGWAMVALGLALAVIALGGDGRIIEPAIALGLAVVLMVFGTLLSLRSLRYSDELMRAVMAEATQITWYLMLFIVGGWAALAHLGMVLSPAMLDLLTAFWAFNLVAAFWASGRRGMLNPR